MAKPLVSSTLFTFPKLLLWSLPLFFVLLGSWLAGGFGNGAVSSLIYGIKDVESEIIQHLFHNSTKPILHDATFNPDFILRVTEQEHTQSCLTKPDVILINGTTPGPELRLIEGKIYWIRVYNDMRTQNVTMHWHGLSMAVSPFSDGTPGASQWPIPPLHFFDYELEVEIGHAGTYFYHSHVGFQAVTAAGPLIVEDAGPHPYQYDEDRIIALADIYTKSDADIESGLLGNPFQWSGEPDNLLVNGMGQIAGKPSSESCSPAHILVEPDKTYRFRFIGGTALSFVSLAFEEHSDMILIEADGDYTKPVNISHLQIGSGQRFSVLFKTKPRAELTKTQFYIQLETRDRPKLIRSYAILKYTLSTSKRFTQQLNTSPLPFPPSLPPLTLPPTIPGWLDYKLEPLHPDPDFPQTSLVTRRITVRTHQILSAGSITWAQDEESWIETFPTEPYLVSLYKNDSIEFPSLPRALLNGGIDPITRVFPARLNETIEIIIQNTGSDTGSIDTHPFHAHGAHYYDLGSGPGIYDPILNEARIANLSLARRDTTMLHSSFDPSITTASPNAPVSWRAWRLRITQPGVWMIHCHILQHMVMGMQTVWVMGDPDAVLLKDVVDQEHIREYLEYGGGVYGNETFDPSVVHFKGLGRVGLERWFNDVPAAAAPAVGGSGRRG